MTFENGDRVMFNAQEVKEKEDATPGIVSVMFFQDTARLLNSDPDHVGPRREQEMVDQAN